MEDILDIYKQPYDAQCPQVCIDEMSTQLIGEVRAPLPAEPGKPLRYDTEYKRNGTANIFMAFEPLAGQRYTKVTEQRTKVDWAHFIQELVDQHYPHVEKICLVMDNLNTHTKASLYEAFDPPEAKRIADKLDIHYTPKHGSWLNMAEIELSHLESSMPWGPYRGQGHPHQQGPSVEHPTEREACQGPLAVYDR